MQWQEKEIDEDGSYLRITGMDPFADWLVRTARSEFMRGRDDILIPFIYTPLEETALSIFSPVIMDERAGIEIVFPQLYDLRGMKPGDSIVGLARKSFFDELASATDGALNDLRIANKQIKLSLPLKQLSLPPEKPVPLDDPPMPKGAWPPNTVVVAIIDDGIAFAHDRFRTSDGKTRVQFFWQQDGSYEESGSTVDFGREIWKENLGARKGIDALLADCTTAGIVDEEKLYRISRLIDFTLPDHKAAAFNRAHGTHVLDLAAGYDPSFAPANMPIIAVQLPVATTADTSGSGLEVFVKAAVDYILDRSRRLAGTGPPLPVVINFSYGAIAGPHDGTSVLESAIDKSITDRNAPLNMVLPAGNSHLSRCHAEIVFSEENRTVTLNWRVQPDDLTLTQMEIWMPHDGAAAAGDRVTIQVETPSGLQSAVLGETHGALIRLKDNNEDVARLSYSFMPFPTERGVFCISLMPTARLRPLEAGVSFSAVAPSGVWKVIISNASLSSSQAIQAWIQRDDVIYGYPQRGRQSYFEDECYTRFHPITGDFATSDNEEDSTIPPCQIKRRGLINAIATGNQTTVIGGVYGKELTVVEYSAGGPVTGTRGAASHRAGPDAVAVSDDSKVHRGVIAAGSRSGSAVEMNGTSVAVPQITRAVAELMALSAITGGPAGDRNSIRQLAAQQETPRPQTPSRPATPNEIVGGEGRIITARPGRLPR